MVNHLSALFIRLVSNRLWNYSLEHLDKTLESQKSCSASKLSPQRISVSENHQLLEWLSHFDFALTNQNTSQERIRDALRKQGLGNYPIELVMMSGGEAQRLALLGLTLQETECWLLDEHGNHLDPSVAHKTWTLIEWQHGIAIVLVTHNINIILQHLPAELWSSVNVVGIHQGTIHWTTSMDNPELPKYLGDLLVSVGNMWRSVQTKRYTW